MVDATSLTASAEGDADMGLVSRLCRPALGVLVLLVLTSLPTLRSERIPGSALTPRIAVAGGSPDETLDPRKHDAGRIQIDPTETDVARVSSTPVRDLKVLRQWEIYYSVFRIFAQRLI
jgi:hypothetical protein